MLCLVNGQLTNIVLHLVVHSSLYCPSLCVLNRYIKHLLAYDVHPRLFAHCHKSIVCKPCSSETAFMVSAPGDAQLGYFRLVHHQVYRHVGVDFATTSDVGWLTVLQRCVDLVSDRVQTIQLIGGQLGVPLHADKNQFNAENNGVVTVRTSAEHFNDEVVLQSEHIEEKAVGVVAMIGDLEEHFEEHMSMLGHEEHRLLDQLVSDEDTDPDSLLIRDLSVSEEFMDVNSRDRSRSLDDVADAADIDATSLLPSLAVVDTFVEDVVRMIAAAIPCCTDEMAVAQMPKTHFELILSVIMNNQKYRERFCWVAKTLQQSGTNESYRIDWTHDLLRKHFVDNNFPVNYHDLIISIERIIIKMCCVIDVKPLDLPERLVSNGKRVHVGVASAHVDDAIAFLPLREAIEILSLDPAVARRINSHHCVDALLKRISTSELVEKGGMLTSEYIGSRSRDLYRRAIVDVSLLPPSKRAWARILLIHFYSDDAGLYQNTATGYVLTAIALDDMTIKLSAGGKNSTAIAVMRMRSSQRKRLGYDFELNKFFELSNWAVLKCGFWAFNGELGHAVFIIPVFSGIIGDMKALGELTGAFCSWGTRAEKSLSCMWCNVQSHQMHNLVAVSVTNRRSLMCDMYPKKLQPILEEAAKHAQGALIPLDIARLVGVRRNSAYLHYFHDWPHSQLDAWRVKPDLLHVFHIGVCRNQFNMLLACFFSCMCQTQPEWKAVKLMPVEQFMREFSTQLCRMITGSSAKPFKVVESCESFFGTIGSSIALGDAFMATECILSPTFEKLKTMQLGVERDDLGSVRLQYDYVVRFATLEKCWSAWKLLMRVFQLMCQLSMCALELDLADEWAAQSQTLLRQCFGADFGTLKHHFVFHLIALVRVYGLPRKWWTAPLEGMHKLVKAIAHRNSNGRQFSMRSFNRQLCARITLSIQRDLSLNASGAIVLADNILPHNETSHEASSNKHLYASLSRLHLGFDLNQIESECRARLQAPNDSRLVSRNHELVGEVSLKRHSVVRLTDALGVGVYAFVHAFIRSSVGIPSCQIPVVALVALFIDNHFKSDCGYTTLSRPLTQLDSCCHVIPLDYIRHFVHVITLDNDHHNDSDSRLTACRASCFVTFEPHSDDSTAAVLHL